MANVKYKKFIKARYEKDGVECSRFQGGALVSGTSKWDEDFIHEGIFMSWGLSTEENNSNITSYSVALVLNPDGTVEEVLPSNILFLKEAIGKFVIVDTLK